MERNFDEKNTITKTINNLAAMDSRNFKHVFKNAKFLIKGYSLLSIEKIENYPKFKTISLALNLYGAKNKEFRFKKKSKNKDGKLIVDVFIKFDSRGSYFESELIRNKADLILNDEEILALCILISLEKNSLLKIIKGEYNGQE